MRRTLTGLMVLTVMLLGPAAAPRASAQATASLTETDIARLRTAITDARSDLDRARSRDAQLAATLTTELNGLSDEVVYLDVKLKKEKQVSRTEYLDLRDRIDDLRTRAQGSAPAASPRTDTMAPESAIPVGTELDVRLLDPLSSARNVVEDRFRATTVVDLRMGDEVLIPAGSELRGVVTSVDKAGRVDRKGSMTLAFDRLIVNNTQYPMRGTVTQALEAGMKNEAAKLGIGATAGAILGGILGGTKGAVAGVLIGGGGIAAATPGSDAELAPGTILRIRLDQPPAVGNEK